MTDKSPMLPANPVRRLKARTLVRRIISSISCSLRASSFGLLSPFVTRHSSFLPFAFVAFTASAATLTPQTNVLGPTPTLLACNAGHFFPGSNTRDWWRYSGVNGARLFISPSTIEPSDDFKPIGDGVSSAATFLARRAALRADPLNTNYINWPYFTNRYESTSSPLVFGYALRELRRLGVESCAQITVSLSRFTIAGDADWAGKWEVWQHFYAQSFYLAREYGVQRFQMFNEPNHSNAGGLTLAEFLQRLQLCSDAAQCAIADVNRLYGRSLTPLILAPVTAGSADGSYAGWGESVVTNRHLNFLGDYDPVFWLAHKYDYHQYNSTPASFGSSLASLRSRLATAMDPEPAFPVAISEFNVHTAATFDTLTETLDSPSKYSRFGAIAVNLAQQGCDEFYAFKFSQTFSDGTVKKNGLHYVDNDHAPYNIGGVTQAGEVWRLFAKAAATGGSRLSVSKGTGTENLDVLATHHAGLGRRALLLVNNTTSPVELVLNLNPWNLPAGQRVCVAEVSEDCLGAGRFWTNLNPGQTLSGSLPTNSVWLFTAPTRALGPVQTLIASDDAMVKDGSNRNVNYGASTSLWVKNNATNANARNVTFLKFQVPTLHAPDLQFAVLRLWASAINGGSVRAHVFGLTNSNWSQTTLKWANAPNLLQNIAPGSAYTNNVVTGAGDSALLLGQLAARGGTASEKTLDVMDFVRANAGREITFLISRDVRFAGDAQDTDGLDFISLEGSPTRGPRLDLVRLLDADGDGLSDDAERTTFQTDPTRADTDGDAAGDGDEVQAGTNPRDPASALRLSAQLHLPDGVKLGWATVSNRAYRLFRGQAWPGAAWLEVFSGRAIGPQMQWFEGWTNTAPPPGRACYRVLVEPLP
jgi:hypothetical protein